MFREDGNYCLALHILFLQKDKVRVVSLVLRKKEGSIEEPESQEFCFYIIVASLWLVHLSFLFTDILFLKARINHFLFSRFVNEY